MRRYLVFILVFGLVSACSKQKTPAPAEVAKPDEKNLESEEAPARAKDEKPLEGDLKYPKVQGLEDLVAANQGFAFDFHKSVDRPNLVYSPHSLAVALGSLSAGMAGESREAIAKVFHFDRVDDEALHDKFYRLSQVLESREREDDPERGVRLKITNALWPQEGTRFTTEFQKIAEARYLMQPTFLDFVSAPEESRKKINDFVADATSDKIPDLLPAGSITDETRLVITNAVYFNAAWQYPFSKSGTRDAPFETLDGEVKVPMMSQDESFGFLEADDYKFIELPYVGGDVVTYVLLPERGKFERVDRSVTPQKFEWMRENVRAQRVSVKLPKFKVRSNLDAKKILAGMGMKPTFDNPDFTPMFVNPNPKLGITAIVHEAFISVDEAGTEAAAATGVVVGVAGMLQPATKTFHADRPFTFFVVDKPTGAILFTARVTNPAG